MVNLVEFKVGQWFIIGIREESDYLQGTGKGLQGSPILCRYGKNWLLVSFIFNIGEHLRNINLGKHQENQTINKQKLGIGSLDLP